MRNTVVSTPKSKITLDRRWNPLPAISCYVSSTICGCTTVFTLSLKQPFALDDWTRLGPHHSSNCSKQEPPPDTDHRRTNPTTITIPINPIQMTIQSNSNSQITTAAFSFPFPFPPSIHYQSFHTPILFPTPSHHLWLHLSLLFPFSTIKCNDSH